MTARIDGWLRAEDVSVASGLHGVTLYVGESPAVVLTPDDAEDLAAMLGLASANSRKAYAVKWHQDRRGPVVIEDDGEPD